MDDAGVPEIGDVLFVNTPDSESKLPLITPWASGLFQRFVDPATAAGDRAFAHVAIVVDRLLALEAVPTRARAETDPPFALSLAVERGKWTKAELLEGVRLVPIADLVVPAMEPGGELVVLRSPDAVARALCPLSPCHPDILRLLGCEYSTDALKTEAEAAIAAKLGRVSELARLVGDRIKLSSSPMDVATRIGLDSGLREQLAATLPDYVPQHAARTFFCSQLAAICLEIGNLLQSEIPRETTTPTGLYRLLLDQRWTDCTSSYHSPPRPISYLECTPETHYAIYTRTLRIILSGSITYELDERSKFMESVAATVATMATQIVRHKREFDEHFEWERSLKRQASTSSPSGQEPSAGAPDV